MYLHLAIGYGKSLIFQSSSTESTVARRLGKSHNFLEKPILIVICKLNSFIDSHVRELRKRGCRADFTEGEKAILDGEFTFVFCNPESIIRNAKWREMVSFEIYKTNLLAFVLTDKVHVGPKRCV